MQNDKQTRSKDHMTSRGMLFPNDGNFVTGKVRRALRLDRYELRESEAVMTVVRKDDVVVELGAGIGYMSTLVATKRQIKAVHAFEANPHLVPYIKRVHAANNVTNAFVENAILGTRAGSVNFHLRRDFIASSLNPDEGGEIIETTKVKVMNAKTVFEKIRPNVLICDIEGAEADLIPAMDLSGLRAAVIELHPQWIGPEGMLKVFQAFTNAGLAYFARGSAKKVISFKRQW